MYINHRHLLTLALLAAPLAGGVGCGTGSTHDDGSSLCPADPVTGARCFGSTSPPAGAFVPADLQSAYGLEPFEANGPPPGTLVAIFVINGFYATAYADNAVYRSTFGLPPINQAPAGTTSCPVGPCLAAVNTSGMTSPMPAAQSDPGEAALDLSMVSAACPLCNILLIEGNSPVWGVDVAQQYGASVLTISGGRSEFAAQLTRDPAFDDPGMAVFAAAGDAATQANDGVSWPAMSQYVTAVGGTLLTRDATTARGWDEVFIDSGWGCSAFEPQPPWQTTAMTGCTTKAGADISASSGPMAVYYTGTDGASWHSIGGSSSATPLAAGIYALTGNGATDPSYSYTHRANFYDITQTKSGGGPGTCGTALCEVGPGWDGPTGNGSPNAQAMLNGFYVPQSSMNVSAGLSVQAPIVASGAWASSAPVQYSLTGAAPPAGAHASLVTSGATTYFELSTLGTLAPQPLTFQITGSAGGSARIAYVTVNVTPCVAQTAAVACKGQDCGAAQDICGNTFACGTCSGATPDCNAGTCSCDPKICSGGEYWDAGICACVACACGTLEVNGKLICNVCQP